MSSALATLWARNRWLVLAFAAALALTLILAARTVVVWVHWPDPATRDQPIEPWMTPRFVAMSWHVPREIMEQALDQPQDAPPAGGPKSIAEIATEKDLTEEQLIALIQQAIDTFRAQQGAPRP